MKTMVNSIKAWWRNGSEWQSYRRSRYAEIHQQFIAGEISRDEAIRQSVIVAYVAHNNGW